MAGCPAAVRTQDIQVAQKVEIPEEIEEKIVTVFYRKLYFMSYVYTVCNKIYQSIMLCASVYSNKR